MRNAFINVMITIGWTINGVLGSSALATMIFGGGWWSMPFVLVMCLITGMRP